MTTPQPAPQVQEVETSLPKYSASEKPVTRGDRIAFQVWVIFFLLSIACTLVQFLAAWLA